MTDDIVTRLRDRYPDVVHPHILRDAILTHEAAYEIERLRRLGDTMAHFVRTGEAKEMYSAVHAWEEARRG